MDEARLGKGCQAAQVDVAFIVGVEARDEARQHATGGGGEDGDGTRGVSGRGGGCEACTCEYVEGGEVRG